MKPFLFAVSLVALAACDPGVETRRDGGDSGDPAPAARAELRPGGPTVTLQPEPGEDQNLQWAASVVRIDELERQEPFAKLFGLAGGDPAMNGLYTYLAVFESPGSGWRVFRLGDFLDYRVLGEGQNRVDLEIQESVMDEATGEIGSRTRRLIVSWTPGAPDEGPASISVTPAS